MVTYGGEQSLDRYLALSARGIPFNVAHAAGNFVIALAAGPALVRMISRFRDPARVHLAPGRARCRWCSCRRWLAVGGGRRRSGASRRGESSAAWLARAQNADGGFAATPGQPSSPAMTGWAMLGLEAAGTQPARRRARAARRPVAYLRAEADRLRSVGDLERTILALDGGRASTRAASPATTWSPSCADAATATARSTARST